MMRLKNAARAMAAAAVMMSGLAFTGGQAQATALAEVFVYFRTNGAPSGAGPFTVTIPSSSFSASTLNAANNLAATLYYSGAGSFDMAPVVSSNGFATGPSGELPFFVESVYCADSAAPSVHLTLPITYFGGQHFDCYVSFDKAASMTLTKSVPDGPSEWEFEFGLDNGTNLDGTADPDVDDVHKYPNQDSTSVSWTEVLKPGAEYTVHEYSDTYLLDVDCGDGTGTFTPAVGESINCAATNYPSVGLEVEKHTNGSDGEFHFTLTHGATGPVDLALTTHGADSDGTGTAFSVFYLTHEGDYTITEVDQAGWNEGTIECTVTHDDDSTTVSTDGTFSIVRTDSVSCLVLNRRPLNVSMVKTVTGNPEPAPGGTTQYTMVITNNSTQYWAVNVVMLDELPAHLVPTDTPSAGCVVFGQTFKCKLAPLAPGASVTVVVNVQVAADATVPVSLANTATLYDWSVEVEAQTPISSANLSATGANTTLLLQLALATIGLGALILTFSRRRALR